MTTPGGGSENVPLPGYYPDPSIPGYIRYWNGAAWVPGTSRPAPKDGEDMPVPPQGAAPPPQRQTASAPDVPAQATEETGPMFLDEESADSGAGSGPGVGAALPEQRSRGRMDVRQSAETDWNDPRRLHGSRPEPASAWQADASRQTGFGDDDHRVSWGSDPADSGTGGGGAGSSAGSASSDRPADAGRDSGASAAGASREGAADPGSGPSSRDRGPRDAGTQVIRADRRRDAGSSDTDRPADGTMAIRAPKPGATGGDATAPPARDRTSAQRRDETMAIRATPRETGAAAGDGTMAIRSLRPGSGPGGAQTPASGPASASASPSAAAQGSAGAPAPAPARTDGGVPPQPSPSLPPPVTQGPGGGQPSWAQQVHQLAHSDSGTSGQGDSESGPVTPWRPPVNDPFLQAAQAQASVRPATLGPRFAARLIDSVLLGAIIAAPAVPLGQKAVDHIDQKIEAAKLSGETVTVWLLDGTTGGYLGIVLGVLLVAGLLFEVLPTAKWGRTLGKRLCRVKVLDIDSNEPPAFGAAFRRWSLYSVLGLLGIGVVGVLWGVIDRPWRQCWHDKAARTFVAGDGREGSAG
ncbi:RDD family protein [Streptomyces sp. KR80]|uniref:RDD family protein n=1 Tax=Streptomyces sp. KR80 TaxID=3457426 RepID=UPI003FD18D79